MDIVVSRVASCLTEYVSVSVSLINKIESCPPEKQAAATIATSTIATGSVEASPSRVLRDGEGMFSISNQPKPKVPSGRIQIGVRQVK
jgi:hypothetical protein